jgi:uncharacterized protein (DUF362 family)
LAHSQSRVVVVWDTNAVQGSTIDTAVVRLMMNAGIKVLTDSTTVGGAWKSCFPGITAGQNICLKVNCAEPRLPSHQQVTRAVVTGLSQMTVGSGTFRPWRAIAFDWSDAELTAAGYTIRTDTLGYRCVGNSHAGWGYEAKTHYVMGTTERFPRILTDSSAFMVNLCCLKDHVNIGPKNQFTLAMKNHLGTIDSAMKWSHVDGRRDVPNLMKFIRDSLGGKEKVYLIDALFAIYNGGPGGSPQAIPRTLILSRDPVACDSEGVELINNLRKDHGLGPRNSSYLAYAESIGLGSRNIQVIRLINPSAVELPPPAEGRSSEFALLPPHPNPFTGTTEVTFLLPRPGEARLEVYNVLGERVRTLTRGDFPAGRHTVVWEGKSDSGHRSSPGVYFLRLHFGRASIERSLGLVQ